MKEHSIPGVIIAAVACLFCVADSVSPTVRAKQGGSAVLKCSLTAPDEGSSHVVEWVRQGYDIPVLIKFGAYAPRVHPNYEGRVSLSGGTSLRLEALILEDGGWYECRVLLLDKPSDEARNGSWTLLSVTAPPIFSETPPTNTEAFQGRPVTLKCAARGNPLPTIKWYKDGILVKESSRVKLVNGSLFVSAVSRETAGQYQCQASNTEGNTTHTTQLRVKGPPNIVIPPVDVVFNLSHNGLLQCQAEADPPNMTYVWMKEGENVYHIESMKSRVKVMVDGTLLITHLIPVDSGNYTCMPTNGLPAPPTASAILTVRHPAQVTKMPEQTFLGMGMRGVISCPTLSEPTLLRVEWTRDGRVLDLSVFPGWTQNAEGSIVIAAVTEDAAGLYTCTPYNSYGTAGRSEPTTVLLQEPPSLRVSPRVEYMQDVGRSLHVPCQADGDPAPAVTWSKQGSFSPPIPLFSVGANGSLLLEPLSKEHHGKWECSITNRVATITVSTTILVLGTSPHAVSSVSVEAGVNHANVSWEPGFDGGYTQTFTIWWKCVCPAEGEQQEWHSVSAQSSSTSLVLNDLLPSTQYHFSVLAHNKLGSGPFSEIITVRTLDAHAVVSMLEAPALLSFNQSSEGVYLWWEEPLPQDPPIDGFILQSRLEEGEWLNLDEDISANKSEMLVEGLMQNCNYELRLLSRRGDQLSLPSRSIIISTTGMNAYPTTSRLLEFVPQPLLAGLMGGMGFLCLALLLALATVCVIGRGRSRRCRKMTEDLPPAVCKSPSMKAGSSPDTPDSILKQKLLPPRPLSSSSSSSDHSSFGKPIHSDYHGQRQQLLPRAQSPSHTSVPESRLHRTSQSHTPPVELIHRGPDGRFMLESYQAVSIAAPSRHLQPHQNLPQSPEGPCDAAIWKSHSLCSYRDERKAAPFVLSVDMPSCGSDILPSGRVQAMAKLLPLRGCYTLPHEIPHQPADQSSLSSKSSVSVLSPHSEKHLPLQRDSTRSTASTLVLQMEHEREQGNLSRCLRLAHEREELEQELRQYTLNRHAALGNAQRAGSLRVEQKKDTENDQSGTFKSRATGSLNFKQLSSRGQCLSNNVSNPEARPSSCVLWGASSVMAASGFVPAQTSLEESGECLQESHFSDISNYRKSSSMKCGEHENSLTKERNQSHTITEGVQGEVSTREQERTHYAAEGSLRASGTCNHNQHYIVHGVSHSADTHLERKAEKSRVQAADYVEMCVDGPELQAQTPPTRSTQDQSHDALDFQRPSLYQLERESHTKTEGGNRTVQQGLRREMERLSSQSSRTLPSVDGVRPTLPKSHSVGSQHLIRYRSAPSLDSIKKFLPPDAWIDSLGHGQNSTSPFLCGLSSVEDKPQITSTQNTENAHVESQVHSQKNLISSGASTDDQVPPYIVSEHCSPPISLLQGYSSASRWHSLPCRAVLRHMKEEEEEDEPEVDAEIHGYRIVPEVEGSYRSYASQSSGRGSLDHPNSQESPSLSTPLTSSPDTTEESDRDESSHTERPRRASVDENYEWDSHYVSMQPADHKTSVRTGEEEEILEKATKRRRAVDDSMTIVYQTKKGVVPVVLHHPCVESLLEQDINNSSMCYQEPEQDAVLF